MFHKVHFQLTAMCTGITAAIMIIMSLSYLYVAETGLRRNHFLTFKSDMNTMITNLEQQDVISFEWLSKMELQKNYVISILDAGIPFLFNGLRDSTDDSGEREQLLNDALSYFNETIAAQENTLDIASAQSPYSFYHTEYEFTALSTEKNYYGCVGIMGQQPDALQIIVVAPLDEAHAWITEQRIRFFMIDVLSIMCLAVFSWFFTWRLLKPIEENRQQQIQFVAAASHELRTPLAVIMSCLAALKAESRSGMHTTMAGGRNHLHVVESESMRMSGLIEDMLTLSRSDHHTWNIKTERIQADTLLLNTYETFETMASEKELRYEITLPEQSLFYINGDKDRLTQVLNIFLHNAISYTSRGGSVSVRLNSYKKQVGFLIRDTGPGIPDAEKEKIFNRFYRIDKTRTTKDHFGLGLSIAYEIVAAHKGRIYVRDNPGGGSCFEAVFPAV